MISSQNLDYIRSPACFINASFYKDNFKTNYSDTSIRYIAFSTRFCDRSHWNYEEPPELDDHDGDAPDAAAHAYRNVEAFLIRPNHQNQIIQQIMLHQHEAALEPGGVEELYAEDAHDYDTDISISSSNNSHEDA